MTARERWQALQTTLTAARAAVERGDKDAALAAVSAALELDPNFLAAHSLRDRIVSGELPVREAAAAPSAAAADTALPADVKPASLDEGYAQFEQRAKRRRVDRRVEAARLALEKKHLRHAAAALDEVIELDPNLPELTDLTVRFDQLRRSSAGSHRGPWLVAAGVFAASVLGATWLQESSALLSRSMIAPAPLLAAPTPSAISFDVDAVATTGEREPAEAAELSVVPRQIVAPAEPPAVVNAVATSTIARPIDQPVVDASASASAPPVPQAPPVVVPPPRPVQEFAVSAPVTPPVPPKIDEVDEHALVRQTLQRYRSAYEGLDAQSAHAVWPAVNEVALARAFDGLQSQALTFDACDVRVRGDAATATCQGTARYVPKVGSREPRTEPRVWNFTLHKTGADWKIDSARADRN